MKTLYLRAELMENYRCHKNILKFASDMFYNSCVKPSGVTAHIKVPHGFLYPLVFVCTGFDQIKGYTQNVNEREADILMRMISEHATRDGVDAACVMSSSRSQVHSQSCIILPVDSILYMYIHTLTSCVFLAGYTSSTKKEAV